ncbi:uncharacterized protein RJT21DRAFT_118232 [Scheffersomyces amazonensis]|uniref:uncharacterized protein n=1 Tax=Scheffersomyces amazonensis TaxID=1078765 RepID=UPI00315D93AF
MSSPFDSDSELENIIFKNESIIRHPGEVIDLISSSESEEDNDDCNEYSTEGNNIQHHEEITSVVDTTLEGESALADDPTVKLHHVGMYKQNSNTDTHLILGQENHIEEEHIHLNDDEVNRNRENVEVLQNTKEYSQTNAVHPNETQTTDVDRNTNEPEQTQTTDVDRNTNDPEATQDTQPDQLTVNETNPYDPEQTQTQYSSFNDSIELNAINDEVNEMYNELNQDPEFTEYESTDTNGIDKELNDLYINSTPEETLVDLNRTEPIYQKLYNYTSEEESFMDVLELNGVFIVENIPFIYDAKDLIFYRPTLGIISRKIRTLEAYTFVKMMSLFNSILNKYPPLQRDSTGRLMAKIKDPRIIPEDLINCEICPATFSKYKYVRSHMHSEHRINTVEVTEEKTFKVKDNFRITGIIQSDEVIDLNKTSTTDNLVNEPNKDAFLSIPEVQLALSKFKGNTDFEYWSPILFPLVLNVITADRYALSAVVNEQMTSFFNCGIQIETQKKYSKYACMVLAVYAEYNNLQITADSFPSIIETFFIKYVVHKHNPLEEYNLIDYVLLSMCVEGTHLTTSSIRESILKGFKYFLSCLVVDRIGPHSSKLNVWKWQYRSTYESNFMSFFKFLMLHKIHIKKSPRWSTPVLMLNNSKDHISVGGSNISIQQLNQVKDICEEEIYGVLNNYFDASYLDIANTFTETITKFRPNTERSEYGIATYNRVYNIRNIRNIFKRRQQPYDKKGMLKVFNELYNVQFYIFVLILIGVGVPYRGSEVLTMRIRNYTNSPSNVMLHDGSLMFITSYSKTMHYKGRVKRITKLMPQKSSQLIYAYLHYTRGLMYHLAVQLQSTPPTEDDIDDQMNDEIEEEIDDEIIDIPNSVLAGQQPEGYSDLTIAYRYRLFVSLTGNIKMSSVLSNIKSIFEKIEVEQFGQRKLRQSLHFFVHTLPLRSNNLEHYSSLLNRMADHSDQTSTNWYGRDPITGINANDQLLMLEICSHWHNLLTVGGPNIIEKDPTIPPNSSVTFNDIENIYKKYANGPINQIDERCIRELTSGMDIFLDIPYEQRIQSIALSIKLQKTIDVNIIIIGYQASELLKKLEKYEISWKMYDALNSLLDSDVIIFPISKIHKLKGLISIINASNYKVNRLIIQDVHEPKIYEMFRDIKSTPLVISSSVIPRSWEIEQMIGREKISTLKIETWPTPTVTVNYLSGSVGSVEQTITDTLRHNTEETIVIVVPNSRLGHQLCNHLTREFKVGQLYTFMPDDAKEIIISKIINNELNVVVTDAADIDLAHLKHYIIAYYVRSELDYCLVLNKCSNSGYLDIILDLDREHTIDLGDTTDPLMLMRKLLGRSYESPTNSTTDEHQEKRQRLS